MVWSPYTKRNIDKLERVQRATKLILKSDDPYDVRLKKLNLMSLEKRRLLTVTFSYNSNINIDVCLTNRFHVAVRLYSNRLQMTSKCGKNKKGAHEAIAEYVTDVLTSFSRLL